MKNDQLSSDFLSTDSFSFDTAWNWDFRRRRRSADFDPNPKVELVRQRRYLNQVLFLHYYFGYSQVTANNHEQQQENIASIKVCWFEQEVEEVQEEVEGEVEEGEIDISQYIERRAENDMGGIRDYMSRV